MRIFIRPPLKDANPNATTKIKTAPETEGFNEPIPLISFKVLDLRSWIRNPFRKGRDGIKVKVLLLLNIVLGLKTTNCAIATETK